MADEIAAKEAVNTALMAAHAEYTDLERTDVSVWLELEGEGAVCGSSVISRLQALGGRIAEHAKSTFCLGVLRALAVVSMHYIMDLQRVSSPPSRGSPPSWPRSWKPTSPHSRIRCCRKPARGG